MLSIQVSDFAVELKEGALRNVGASNKTATAKLYDVESATAREFGGERVKLAFVDEEGNEVEVALFPAEVRSLLDDLGELEDGAGPFQ